MKILPLIVLLVSSLAQAGEPPLPAPVSATAYVCALKDGPQIVSAVMTYADGKVVRFDGQNMHGFDVPQLMVYFDSAPDSKIYTVRCLPAQTST